MPRLQLNWSNLQPLNLAVIATQPATSGVYRLSYKSADGNYYVFYVGNAMQSLRDALAGHLGDGEENVCIKTTIKNLECYFKLAELPSPQERIKASNRMVIHFKPKCNPPQDIGELTELNFD